MRCSHPTLCAPHPHRSFRRHYFSPFVELATWQRVPATHFRVPVPSVLSDPSDPSILLSRRRRRRNASHFDPTAAFSPCDVSLSQSRSISSFHSTCFRARCSRHPCPGQSIAKPPWRSLTTDGSLTYLRYNTALDRPLQACFVTAVALMCRLEHSLFGSGHSPRALRTCQSQRMRCLERRRIHL